MKNSLYKNIGAFILLHLFIVICMLVLLILYMQRYNIAYLIALSVLGSILTISIIIAMFSWNTKIHFTQTEIYYFIFGQKHSFRWEDITSCEVRTRFLARGNPLSCYFEITTTPTKKPLTFEYSVSRERFLVKICPNENTRKLFENAFNK